MGIFLLEWALVGDTIGLFRLAIAEAGRFPDLASTVSRIARERAREAVAPLLAIRKLPLPVAFQRGQGRAQPAIEGPMGHLGRGERVTFPCSC